MVDQVAGFTQYHNGGQDPIYGVHIDMSNKGQMMRYNNTEGPSVVSCHAAAHSGQQTFSKRFCKYVQFVSDFLGEIYNLISLLCNFYFFNVHCECPSPAPSTLQVINYPTIYPRMPSIFFCAPETTSHLFSLADGKI